MRRWEELTELLLLQFRSSTDGTLITLCEQFLTVKQETTVKEYRRRFINLVAPLNSITDEVFVGQFINGLNRSIFEFHRGLNTQKEFHHGLNNET